MMNEYVLMKSDPSLLMNMSNLNLKDFEESLLERTNTKEVGFSYLQNSGDSPTRYAFSGNSEFDDAICSPVI